MSNNQSIDGEVALRQVPEMMQQVVPLLNSNKPVEAMPISEQSASLNFNVPGMHYLQSIGLSKVGRYKEALAVSIAAGIEQAKKFSLSSMAKTVSSFFIKVSVIRCKEQE